MSRCKRKRKEKGKNCIFSSDLQGSQNAYFHTYIMHCHGPTCSERGKRGSHIAKVEGYGREMLLLLFTYLLIYFMSVFPNDIIV